MAAVPTGFTPVMANAMWRLVLQQRSAMVPVQSQGYLVVNCVFLLSGALTCMTITNNGLIVMDNVSEEMLLAMEHVKKEKQHVETGVWITNM